MLRELRTHMITSYEEFSGFVVYYYYSEHTVKYLRQFLSNLMIITVN